jgi:hypothetical protein
MKGAGNAIVPHMALAIFRAIEEVERTAKGARH